jgi:NAD(P)-dependent dehydrogenase (short-subunit alcohol dehydrogenase family)
MTSVPPPMRGKTVIVTGATSGIGLAAAREFGRLGATVVAVGRDPARLAQASLTVAETGGEVVTIQADFGSLEQVRGLAAQLDAAYPRIDVLANNAGALVGKHTTTIDGLELTMAANHLAPFLLTNLLRPRLSGGRVITTASDAHRNGALDPADLDSAKQRYVPLRIYGSSKQANILFAAESARRWSDIISTSYHPGVVRTRFGSNTPLVHAFYRWAPLLRTPEQGADTLVWLAQTDPGSIVNGGYYERRRLTPPSRRTADPDLASQLWQASLAAVGLD